MCKHHFRICSCSINYIVLSTHTAKCCLLNPLKTSERHSFSDVIRRYKKTTLCSDELIELYNRTTIYSVMTFTPVFLFIHSCCEILFLQNFCYTEKEIYFENNFLLAKYPHCLLFCLDFHFLFQYTSPSSNVFSSQKNLK